MITQTFRQGENIIKIESAESIEDAKKNNFRDSEYSRYFINDNQVDNYMSIIQYMIEATHKNKQNFIPDNENLIKMRNDMLKKQNEEMKKQIENIKKIFGSYPIPESTKNIFDSMIDKIDEYGIRVTK